MAFPARRTVLPALVLLTVGVAAPVGAHTAGSCPPTGPTRCETWSYVVDTASADPDARSDQFTATVLSSATTTFHVGKDVSLNPDDPYAARGRSLVVALDNATGEQLWSVPRSDDVYLNTTDATLSADGSRLFVTGGAYDAFPVAAKDSRLTTTAYDTADGRELWSTAWDGRPGDTDNGKVVVASPDGSQVYATGVTTSPDGDLDYATIGYDADDGTLLWSQVYDGPGDAKDDAPFGLAVAPDGKHLYVTGWSTGPVEYDSDYATVAYALTSGGEDRPGNGRGPKPRPEGHPGGGPAEVSPPSAVQAWVARYDGIGQNRSDRANAVAVDPDGSRVYVTGDSYAGPGGGDYAYATVAYDAVSGRQLWDGRWSGERGGFNAATSVVAGGGRVLVTGQSPAPSDLDGYDAATVAYDAVTGAQSWQAAIALLRSDDHARGIALSPDGGQAYVVATVTPIVKYTALSRLSVAAYDVRTGAVGWTTDLDAGAGNALKGAAVSVSSDGGTVAVAGDVTRSADPLGPPSQNVYDALVAAFPA